MATNPYFKYNIKSEQNLYEDLIIESLKMYGQDVYYIPRDTVGEDRILGEEVPSRYNSAYVVEMYIENTEGYDGEGDLFTKFGIEIRDQATFIVSKRRWTQTVARHDNEITVMRPAEGDLIFIPLTSSLFQIMHVEHEQPFYQLSNLPTFKLRCELFEYNDENFDTGVTTVDKIEKDYAYEYILTLDSAGHPSGWNVGNTVSMTLSDGVVMSGEISRWADSDLQLHLIHVGADDGTYHTFVSGRTIQESADNVVLVSAVTENNQISRNEQNDDFATEAYDFLDFSESNPFGDPS